MKFKRVTALSLAVVLIIASTGICAFASSSYPPSWCGYYNDESSRGRIVDMETGQVWQLPTWEEAYAYLDYDSASDELKDKILKARCSIVYSENARWSVDGEASIVNEDGTVTPLPEFASLYPSDWKLADINAKYQELTQAAAVPTALNSGAAFSGMVTVPANASTQATPFYYFTSSGADVAIYAATLPIGYTINFGVKNLNTNMDVAWVGNVRLSQQVIVPTTSGVNYSVRCSSYNGMYSAFLYVVDM